MDFLEQRFGQVIAILLFPLLSLGLYAAGQYFIGFSRQIWNFISSRRRALLAVGREFPRDGAREGKGVWLTAPIHPPADYQRDLAASKILAVANLKGGVGKTTLVANIGAYLATEWAKRVLLIDFDFQGSLSSMAFPDGEWLPSDGQNSIANKLISNDITPDLVDQIARAIPVNGGGQLKLITAYYDLAQADNRLMIEWLLNSKYDFPRDLRDAAVKLLRGKLFKLSDVRYTLANILHSSAVRNAFDLIIIDCPPRLTTSSIQAFCASTHLLIPTIFDRPSAEAVVSFCKQTETLKDAGVCPHLKYIGVVGTMWQNGHTAQTSTRTFLVDALRDGKLPIDLLPEYTFLPRAAAMVNNAEEGIAYLAMPNHANLLPIRNSIGELARFIAGQMGIPQPNPAPSPAASLSSRPVVVA